jgi:hypothetical protein
MKKRKQMTIEEAAWAMFMDTPIVEVMGFLFEIGYELKIEKK